MIRESGQGALGGVEDRLELFINRLNLFLLFGREGRINVDVEVRVGDGADGFGGVVLGPLIQILL